MTASMSSPWRVYFRTGDSGSSARKSHSRRMAEPAAVGSPDPAKAKMRKRPSALGDVAEVDGLGIRETDDRRRVKALADHETLGQMLVVCLRR